MSTVAPFGQRTAAEIRQMHQAQRDRNQARHDDTVDFMAELAKAERLVAIGKGDGVTAYDGAAFQDTAAEVLPGWRPA